MPRTVQAGLGGASGALFCSQQVRFLLDTRWKVQVSGRSLDARKRGWGRAGLGVEIKNLQQIDGVSRGRPGGLQAGVRDRALGTSPLRRSGRETDREGPSEIRRTSVEGGQMPLEPLITAVAQKSPSPQPCPEG